MTESRIAESRIAESRIAERSSGTAERTGVVAIIPARGGSKGVPGKNLRRVGGVPLVARAAASARHSALIERVIVSTDDRAIAAAAIAEGAEIMARPAKLSGDKASSESALLNVLERLADPPQIVVFLQATSPFIDPVDLDAAIIRVRDGECDVVFSAVETHAFLWRATPDGAAGVNHDHSHRARRQDREPQYQETGAFYVMRASGFREARFRFFGRVGIAVTDERRAIEIDTAPQLELASAIASLVGPLPIIDIDALVTDFDGVHTDDRVLVGADGNEYVTANRSDGMGVELLRKADIRMLILSKETNAVVSARGRKLGVEVRHGLDDKATALREWATTHELDLSRVAYLGNDVNDLTCMALVGWPVAVADAHPEVRAAARAVLAKRGGHGAVRELADRILEARAIVRASRDDAATGGDEKDDAKEETCPLSLVERG